MSEKRKRYKYDRPVLQAVYLLAHGRILATSNVNIRDKDGKIILFVGQQINRWSLVTLCERYGEDVLDKMRIVPVYMN